MREIPGGTRARHRSHPVDLPEHRYRPQRSERAGTFRSVVPRGPNRPRKAAAPSTWTRSNPRLTAPTPPAPPMPAPSTAASSSRAMAMTRSLTTAPWQRPPPCSTPSSSTPTAATAVPPPAKAAGAPGRPRQAAHPARRHSGQRNPRDDLPSSPRERPHHPTTIRPALLMARRQDRLPVNVFDPQLVILSGGSGGRTGHRSAALDLERVSRALGTDPGTARGQSRKSVRNMGSIVTVRSRITVRSAYAIRYRPHRASTPAAPA
jgi:hypothetical protein